jgi:DNA-binding transcriptional regulator GbsR (MarR family)
MSEVVMHEVLDSLAKIGKQWGLGGESVGRIWSFLLFKSCPVTQREIEEGTGYSRGLISRCLKIMAKMPLIEVRRMGMGKENLYSVNTSLTDGLSELLKHFLTDKINPMIELLSGTVDKIEDAKVRETFLALLHEYKKLHLAIRVFAKIINNINTMHIEVEEVEDVAEGISIKIARKEEIRNG